MRKPGRHIYDGSLPGQYEGGIIVAAGITAAGAAYAANRQRAAAREAAAAAGKPSSEAVNQTTTSSSSAGPAYLQDQYRFASDEARRLYEQGPALRGGGGARGGGAGAGGQVDLSGVVYKDGKPGVMSARGVFQPLGAAATTRLTAGAGAGGAAPRPSMEQQARDSAQQLIDTGRAGNPNLGAVDDYLGRVYEEGGFGGNEVYADLAGRLGNASLDSGTGFLEKFLGPNYGGAGSTGGAGGGGQSEKPAWSGARPAVWNPQPGPTQSAGIGDSTAAPGLFNDWAKEVLGGKYLDPNDPVLKDYLDVIQREGGEELEAALQDVGDEFEGVGMYGGSGLALERASTRTKGQQGLADARTKALYDFRGQGLDLMSGVGGQVNTRDISAADIAAQERMNAASNASSAGSAAAGINAQLQIANRGMDLDAIQAYLQNQQFGLGTLGDIGAGVSSDRLNGIGAMGDLEDVRYGGLERAFGVSNELGKQDAAQRARQQERAYQDRLAPGRHLDEYLDRLGFFSGLGGSTTSTTQGTTSSTNPGAAAPYLANQGPGGVEAGLTAGVGAWLAGQGARRAAASPPQQQAPRGGRW